MSYSRKCTSRYIHIKKCPSIGRHIGLGWGITPGFYGSRITTTVRINCSSLLFLENSRSTKHNCCNSNKNSLQHCQTSCRYCYITSETKRTHCATHFKLCLSRPHNSSVSEIITAYDDITIAAVTTIAVAAMIANSLLQLPSYLFLRVP
jgi:hypothetical protein